jgi:hypothetical protein
VDEKKLAELFNDAVRDVPPASFDAGEVRKASHRATIKRRNSVVAGSALALVLLAGGTVTTLALSGEMRNTTAASAPALGGAPMQNNGTMDAEGNAPKPAAPTPREESSTQLDSRSGPPKQGGTPTGNAGGAGSTPSGCKVDRELAAALAGELPAAASAIDVPIPFGCPPAADGASVEVVDGAKRGTISVVRVPEGVDPGIALFGGEVSGSANAQALATSGASIFVVSQPAPGTAEPPFVDVIAGLAAELGKQF